MSNIGKIVYLTEAQKDELFTLGSVTSNGTTVTYNQNDLYLTPDTSVEDVKINASSIVSNNTATIPLASTSDFGVIKTQGGKGVRVDSNGIITTDGANASQIKAGTQSYNPITPMTQNTATFYGLAKAAGDNTQSSSDNEVGIYTSGALEKIQKMLDIYEAPWELIREDNFTNASAADYTIDVDDDGDAFSLTDIRLKIWFPTQNNEASNTNGTIYIYSGSTLIVNPVVDTKTLSANASVSMAQVMIEQKNGMLYSYTTTWANQGTITTLRQNSITDTSDGRDPFKLMSEVGLTKIIIKSIKGTMNYRLYGRRKWRT